VVDDVATSFSDRDAVPLKRLRLQVRAGVSIVRAYEGEQTAARSVVAIAPGVRAAFGSSAAINKSAPTVI
jgi:hypothetical protein